MAKIREKLVIIDGHALIHRAYHALPPLTTKKGELVNAVFGFAAMLLKALKDLRPTHILVTFDRKGPTFRHKEYKEYKATREAPDKELYKQIPRIVGLVEAFNIPIFEIRGYEADDLIGTLSKKSGINNVIVTGDMDVLQLVDDKTTVYTLRRGFDDVVIYDEAKVEERYGLKPEQLIDFKGLRGDPSDNIPGVKGIGEKGAIDLLKKFGTLENVYHNLESREIKERTKQALKDHKKEAFLSKKLATIITDIKLDLSLKDCAVRNYDREKVVSLFQELGFKSLINKLPGEEIEQKSLFEQKKEVETVDFSLIKEEKEIVLDVERKMIGAKANVCHVDDWLTVRDILENEKVKKIGHDLKKSLVLLQRGGIELKGLFFDVMIASYLLNPGTRRHDLEDLVFAELGKEKYEDIKDVWQLKELLQERLKKENKLEEMFHQMEMPLVSILAEMEETGVKVDVGFLKKQSKEFSVKIIGLEKKIYQLAGQTFNVRSTQQLKEILFDRLKIDTSDIKKIKTGFSTAASELAKLEGRHPIIDLIEEHRELSKLKSTYLDALPKLADTRDRVHTSFNQTITSTGRLSSTDPNLQNIPIKTEIGREIRKAFVAEKGYKILAADYSQVELRIMAHFSEDRNLIASFKRGEDIHRTTAAKIFHLDGSKVTEKERRVAKSINFGMMYGMGPFGLAKGLGISKGEAKKFIDEYFDHFMTVAIWIKTILKSARENGYVESLFGRRRYLPELKSGVPMLQAQAERMAINMPIQGTAADIIKLAMIEINPKLQAPNSKMILQVHDELVFEVKENEVEKVAREIKEVMENVVKLAVPLEVDLEVGSNWGELEKLQIPK